MGRKTPTDIRMAAFKYPKSTMAEAFRTLRSNLGFAALNQNFRSVLVTSPLANEGKTTTAVNLSIVLAQAGHRVLLVDCDLRLPAVHRVFELDNQRGLTNVLLQQLKPDETALPGPVPGLNVLPSGPIPPNPADLFGSEQMRRIWPALYEKYDYIVVDSPPVLNVTDAALLSSQVDGVLLVVRATRTRIESLQEAESQLKRANARIIGVILNQTPMSGSQGYYSYSYRYRAGEPRL